MAMLVSFAMEIIIVLEGGGGRGWALRVKGIHVRDASRAGSNMSLSQNSNVA